MKTILIMSKDGMYPSGKQEQELKKHTDLEVIVHEGRLSEITKLKNDTSEKLIGVDPDSFGWDMDSGSTKDIPNVKAVFTQSTSFDWVKPELLKKMGVQVVNCAGFSTDSVAEYAIGMAMNVTRHLPVLIKNNWKVDWTYTQPMLLKGKTLGVVGLGKIGKRIAEIGQGIGMKVIYWSRKSRDSRFEYVSMRKLFSTSDIIIPALAESGETLKLFNDNLLDLVKPTSFLVGLNRIKHLWNEKKIIKMVQQKKIAGYAFEGDNAKPLPDYDGNIFALPPMVWYTKESMDNLLDTWVNNIISYAKGKPINVVN
jgi:glycerate dehydrogenase